MNKIYISLFTLLLFSLPPYSTHAQSIINQVELKKVFDEGVNGYPYEVGGNYTPLAYVMHDPAIKLSEGEFIHIWNPSRGSYSKRTIVKYNLLLEELWKEEFELDFEEDIEHVFRNDTAIVILSSKYFYQDNAHRFLARTVNIDSGFVSGTKIVHQCFGKSNQDLMISISPDEQSFILYYFEPVKKNKRLRVYRDFLYTDETLGYKISNAGKLAFKRYNLELEEIDQGEIELDLLPKHKSNVFATQLDNEGNVYVSIFDKPTTMRVIRYDNKSQKQQSLALDQFIDIWTEEDPYSTHVPPVIGSNGKVYLAMAKRVKVRRVWQIQNYEIVVFDFKAELIDKTRHVETNSTLLVQISKAREAFGLKPAKSFDKYLIHNIMEMSNGSLWLMVQKYEYDFRNNAYFAPTPQYATNYRIEELLFFKFDPTGEFEGVFIVPTFQRPEGVDDFESLFFNMKIDKELGEIHMLTHEMDGEKLNEPPRTFYRKINLDTGEYTPRKKVFDGKRRTVNFYKYYTVWLSSSIVSMIFEDGTHGQTYLLTIDLLGEPEGE